MPSIRQALAEARYRADMYRMGGGWIITHYDETVGAYRTLYSQPYAQAQEDLVQIRTDEALRALGHSPDAYGWPYGVQSIIEGRGSLRTRVVAAHRLMTK